VSEDAELYQALFDMYAEIPFGADLVADSFMEVLRLQFTPREAELAVQVGFGGGTLGELAQRTGIPAERLRTELDRMGRKGTVWRDPGVADPQYRAIGIAGPGLVETGGWTNVRFAHSVSLMKALHRFEREFGTRCLPALGFPTARVWAAPDALPGDADAAENVAEQIRQAGAWGVAVCSCRLPHWIADPGNHCHHELETCMFLGEQARWGVEQGMCRAISYDEAVELLRACGRSGLVHTYDPSQFICNCCADCCVFFVGIRSTGARLLHASEFVARVDVDDCDGCATCVDRCPVSAITLRDDRAAVDDDTCLGCGVCQLACPSEAVRLVRRPADAAGQ
jgi:electron transport complex protein RnfB